MKVQLNRGELLTLLEKLKPAVPKKSTLPICTTVLLKAEGRKLAITVNNLEFALMGECRAKGVSPGAICMEFDKFLTFIKRVKGEKVVIDCYTDKGVVISSDGASLSTEGKAPEDFPPVPEVQGEKAIAYNLAEVLGKVDYCMATEEHRPVLYGVSFRPRDKERITQLATADGFRLAVAPLKIKGKLAEMIVPSPVVRAIKKLMPGNVTITQKIEPSKMEKGESYAVLASFEQKGLRMTCSLIQGNFPNYTELIPKTDRAVTIDRDGLLEALKTVLSIKEMKGNSNITRLQTKMGKLLVSFAEDESKCEATVSAKGMIKIAMNAKYLSDLLHHVDEKVTIRTTTPSEPLKVISRGVTVVIMPMLVQWAPDKEGQDPN